MCCSINKSFGGIHPTYLQSDDFVKTRATNFKLITRNGLLCKKYLWKF